MCSPLYIALLYTIVGSGVMDIDDGSFGFKGERETEGDGGAAKRWEPSCLYSAHMKRCQRLASVCVCVRVLVLDIISNRYR